MKYNRINYALVLFVLSTALVLGSTIDAFAVDPDGRGSSGSGDIEACLNLGQPPNAFPCDTDPEWDGGNISRDAGYREGSSIPMRIDITGLEDAPWQQLEIVWDITKTQANNVQHTFDYITSFDRNDEPNPCLNLGFVCENYVNATVAIPPPGINVDNGTGSIQPLFSFNQLPLPERLFTIFAPIGENITINTIGYSQEGDPSDNGKNTEQNRLFVNYTTSSSDVIAAFGAHLASPVDWEFSASDVTGKAFHFGCSEIHAGGGCSGGAINFDGFNILPIDTPTLLLQKNVTNNNGGTAKEGDWTLFADEDSNNGRSFSVFGNNTKAFPVNNGTEYTLTENQDGPDGYTSTGVWTCEGEGEFTMPTSNQILLSEGADITCTIVNDDLGSLLTVIKEVITDNGGTATAANFTMNVNSTNSPQINIPGNATGTTVSINAGPYSVTEDAVAGYNQTNTTAGCTGTAELGQNYVCTITNDDQEPSLTLVKAVTNDNGGTAIPANFELSATGPTGFSGNGTISNGVSFDAGTYDLSELGPTGYTASDWVCSGNATQDDGDTVTIGLGEFATCTITNDDKAHQD